MSDNAAASDAYREDLVDLAQYAFHAAARLCAHCAEYHALWGYGRLVGLNNGVAVDADTMAPVLAALTRPGGRILIAAAADAGLLAFTVEVTHQLAPKLSVADRCATPLAVCRRYVDRHGIALTTVQADLTRTGLAERYDVILVHNFLLFMPDEARKAFLSNLRNALADGGKLMLVNRMPVPQRYGIRPQYRSSANLTDALLASGIALPEEEGEFRARTARLAAAEDSRERELDRNQIEDNLAAADLSVVERIEHGRRKIRLEDGTVETVPTYVFTASAR